MLLVTYQHAVRGAPVLAIIAIISHSKLQIPRSSSLIPGHSGNVQNEQNILRYNNGRMNTIGHAETSLQLILA